MPGGGDVVQSLPAMGKGFGDVQDYFHSTFPDVLIEDLIGFQGSHGDSFEIHPLLPKTKWKFFYLGDLRYHGHDVDILWKEDWSSTTPGMQSKLFVWVDGERDGVEADRAVPEEEASEVDPLDLVKHGVQTRNLPNIIADDVEQTSGDVCLREWLVLGVYIA